MLTWPYYKFKLFFPLLGYSLYVEVKRMCTHWSSYRPAKWIWSAHISIVNRPDYWIGFTPLCVAKQIGIELTTIITTLFLYLNHVATAQPELEVAGVLQSPEFYSDLTLNILVCSNKPTTKGESTGYKGNVADELSHNYFQ